MKGNDEKDGRRRGRSTRRASGTLRQRSDSQAQTLTIAQTMNSGTGGSASKARGEERTADGDSHAKKKPNETATERIDDSGDEQEPSKRHDANELTKR